MAFIVEYNLTPLLSAICLKPQFIREGVAAHTSWIHKQTGCNNYCSDFCSHTVSVFLNKHQTICVFTHIFSPKVRDNEGPVSINHRTGPSFTGQSNSNKSLEKNCFLLDFIVISLIPISIIWLWYYPPRLLQITVLAFISILWNQRLLSINMSVLFSFFSSRLSECICRKWHPRDLHVCCLFGHLLRSGPEEGAIYFLFVCLFGVFPSLNAAPLFQRLKTLQYGDISIIDRIYVNITLNISF